MQQEEDLAWSRRFNQSTRRAILPKVHLSMHARNLQRGQTFSSTRTLNRSVAVIIHFEKQSLWT